MLSQYSRAVSVPSTEASNEVATDREEKEVLGDIQADETLVMEDGTDIEFSREPLADSDSKLLFGAGCLGW